MHFDSFPHCYLSNKINTSLKVCAQKEPLRGQLLGASGCFHGRDSGSRRIWEHYPDYIPCRLLQFLLRGILLGLA